MKIGVVCRAKDEQLIIKDWISHYIDIGFDRVIVYDNMSNPSIKDTLGDDFVNKNKHILELRQDTVTKWNNVASLFQETIDQMTDLDWLLMCDADEFIWLQKDLSIKDFLSRFNDEVGTVLINWLTYGTSKLISFDNNKSLFEQFIRRGKYNNFWNRFVKSFIRPNLVKKFINVHISANPEYRICNAFGNNITLDFKQKIKCFIPSMLPSSDSPCLLIHYMTLDHETMARKRQRNINGRLAIIKIPHKYTESWYAKQGLDDEVDGRMIKL
jgi:hypothetical protein